jgi:alkylhydroperoxidase family enzyme
MTATEAIAAINVELAHLWMIRTFLKHADEIQGDEEMLDVPRTLYDCIRATEPAAQKGDHAEFLKRARGKLSKLKKAAQFFQAEYQRASAHTNFEMAAVSLTGAVERIAQILDTLKQSNSDEANPGTSP